MAKRSRKVYRTKSKSKIKIYLILFLIITVIGGIFATLYYLPIANDKTSKADALALLDRAQLNSNYFMTQQLVYGNQHLLPWDTETIPASSREFTRDADVDVTTAEVKTLVSKTDLTFVNQSTTEQGVTKINYQSKDNKYFQIIISSKSNYDELIKKARLGITQVKTDSTLDPNAGPSVVKIMANPYRNKF